MCIMYMYAYRQMSYNKGTMDKVYNDRRRANLELKRVSNAQRKATDKYLEKFDEVRVRVPKGRKAEIKAHAEHCGESLNGFIIRAITNQMEQDKGN